jgi:hypothetical protein
LLFTRTWRYRTWEIRSLFRLSSRAINLDLFRSYPEPRVRELGRAYTDQIQYLNGRVLAAIDRILAASPEPIVILMGDHGLRLLLRRSARDTCLRETFAILNAIRLPDRDESWLYETISPVNVFRIVFDAYFGTKLGRLPDRSLFAHRPGYYDFVEVTDRVETCSDQVER